MPNYDVQITKSSFEDNNNDNKSNLLKKTCFTSCADIFYVSTNDRHMQNSTKETCPRCGQVVYPFEKIGPIKGQLYHKVCFKCIVCGRQLDLRSYFTNSVDLNDKQIYCQSHFPQSRKGHVDADNFHIRNIMQAPKPSAKQHLNLPSPRVDGMSVGIQHAVNAQNLLHGDKPYQGVHHFPVLPPELVAARKQICQLQKDIELKQKEEEDALFQKFLEERRREEERIEKELDSEWNHNLQELRMKYENGGNNHADVISKFQEEKKYLKNNLTIKRSEKRRSIKQCLLEQERRETTELVARQSKEMLKLMERNRIEIMRKQGIPVVFKNPPPPLPLTKRKIDLYPNANVLKYVDEIAIKVAESEQSSYTELVEQLTQRLISDMEKARAIFKWITVKNLNIIEFKDTLTDESPMWLLRGIKYGTETYHTLFMRLCSYAGLHCVNVKGHSKSFGYEPGLPIKSGQFLNTWNSVLIDDEWRFVQCNWGARHLVMCKDSLDLEENSNLINGDGNQANPDKIEYEYDDHYFFTDPEEFIYEFFPFDPAWQLLRKPLSLSEFENLPFVRSLLFHYSLGFVNQNKAVIIADERGSCDVKLRMPEHLEHDLVFHSQLRIISPVTANSTEYDNNSLSADTQSGKINKTSESDEIDNTKLENFVLHTVDDGIVSFNIHLPKRGAYYLELFANTIRKDISIFGQTFKLRCVCKYKIICEKLKQRMHALPQCANGEWGPAKAVRYYGWKSISHSDAIIESVYSDLYIIFQIPKILRIHCKLSSTNHSALSACPHVITHINNDCVLTICVQLLCNAQYGLDIYAFDPDANCKRKVMSHCCKYLINRSDSFSHLLIGHNRSDNPLIKDVFIPISHVKPNVELQSDQQNLKLLFMVTQEHKLRFGLKFEGDTNTNSLTNENYVSFNRTENNVNVKLCLPYVGRYIFTIYIITFDQHNNSSMLPVYGYAIRRHSKHK
ncbi:hypothetical protein GJ496_006614 [Pomphorhynchus laevis]|nr:hypothetical protein GJ496_006614 [Pomphorhynchus laevis]